MTDDLDSESLLLECLRCAVDAAKSYAATALTRVRRRVASGGSIDPALMNQEQHAVHGYAWIETTVAALCALLDWAEVLSTRGDFGRVESLSIRIAFGEYLAQLIGGLAIGPNEVFRPPDLSLENDVTHFRNCSAVSALVTHGNTVSNRSELVKILGNGGTIDDSLSDDFLNEIRMHFCRFTEERILKSAHDWHLRNVLIPDEIVLEMAELGTFGICIPESYGGSGLGKLAMCIVTEELSRGWIGAGSLGTRSEIAGELIVIGGTHDQKSRWLPKIANGDVLPTAVFTEPDVGSDLGSIKTRAVRVEGGWSINGAKSWITHASRSDLMTVLARTVAGTRDYAGLSMFLVPKSRGSDLEPFPVEGLTGTEITVLGYRGMREYELSFDNLNVTPDSLLGSEEGMGFRQLMRTFEGARIQTAARAVGVARRAWELGLTYALDRRQFGRPIIEFPRISDKIAMMSVDMLLSRELTYFAARQKDKCLRCDIEAGMAKLFASRSAWMNADASVQIHGGNGYALESEVSRVLCDARVLSIFEGSAEIQAHVIARERIEES